MEPHMTNYEIIRELLPTLSADEQAKIKAALDAQPGFSFADLIEVRVNKGVECPRCHSVEFVKNGTRKGIQRYKCKDCNTAFNDLSNSFLSRTHKDFDTWKAYANCIIEGIPLRKAAKQCSISLSTAFYWRHKLLNIVSYYVNRIKLNGVIESDDTFFSVSMKGSTPEDRPAKKRGEPARKRGLSKDKVCVTCAVSRNGKLYSKVATLGRGTSGVLKKVLRKHISDNAILCTDKDSAYRRFAKNAELRLIEVKAGRVKGTYHIQHVNAYHSRLKAFMLRFKGVATKYLDNYLAWHNLIVERKSDVVKVLRNAMRRRKSESWFDVANKPALPI